MFKLLNNITTTVSSSIGKVFGNKENRESFKAEADKRSDKKAMAELGYRQSKLTPFIYTSMVAPFAIMWLSFGFYPIIVEVPIASIQRIALGYYKLIEAFGLNNLTLVIFQFLGISGVSAFKGIKIGSLAKEIRSKRKVQEKQNLIQEQDKVLNYDIDFLEEVEGGNHSKGYTIKGAIGDKSGVTIGIGVDLGYQSIDTYKKVNLSNNLINKLSPYFGVIGDEARKLSKKMPLTLSVADTNKLNEATLKLYAERVRKHFKGLMWTYPEEAQTIIMSRAWHGGTNLPKKAPKFFMYCTAKDWKNVHKELLSFYPKNNQGIMPHAHRLQKEAELIKRVL